MKMLLIKNKRYSEKSVLLDDEDYDFIIGYCRWFLVPTQGGKVFYANGQTLNSRQISMHRLIFQRYNDLHDDILIDHIDGNGLNNQKENLRTATDIQNSQNRRKHNKNTTSIYKGVSKGYKNTWRAMIKVNGKPLSIKTGFPTERMAAIAYDIFARKHYKEYACLNIKDVTDVEINNVIYFIHHYVQKNKTSKFRGVCFDKKSKKWQVCFLANDKVLYCGQYSTEEEAANVYNRRSKEILGDRAKLNII